MLALPADDITERDNRPSHRPYRASVAKLESLTPHFTRVTFTGPDLQFFGTDGLDQRIKLVLPLDGRISDIGVDDEQTLLDGSWYARWRELPDADRNPIRTYTVRAVRPELAEIDVDFVAHGDGGPAARWLLSAVIGDELVIVGPDGRSLHSAGGIDFHPGTATDILLAGDETAAPAICSILESLAPGIRARAFIEVESIADALPIATLADVAVTWIGREDEAAGGRTLESAVRDWVAENRTVVSREITTELQVLDDVNVDVELLWDAPATVEGNSFYAWLAGEATIIKSLRRFLVTDTGIDRKRVSFMGYWRRGRAEPQS